jgi:hypothetical protein
MRRLLVVAVSELRHAFHRASMPVVFEQQPRLIERYGVDLLFQYWLAYQVAIMFNIPTSNEVWRNVTMARHDQEFGYFRQKAFGLGVEVWETFQPALSQQPPFLKILGVRDTLGQYLLVVLASPFSKEQTYIIDYFLNLSILTPG